MQCIVVIVLKIEPAGQVRYNKQQLNSWRRAKHVRYTIEMKSYPSLKCVNGWSSICDLCVVWALHVKHPRFLVYKTHPHIECKNSCKKVCLIRAKIW